MIPWQSRLQGNAAMYTNAHVGMQTLERCSRYGAIDKAEGGGGMYREDVQASRKEKN